MRNTQFYVSGKRPMAEISGVIMVIAFQNLCKLRDSAWLLCCDLIKNENHRPFIRISPSTLITTTISWYDGTIKCILVWHLIRLWTKEILFFTVATPSTRGYIMCYASSRLKYLLLIRRYNLITIEMHPVTALLIDWYDYLVSYPEL